MRRGPRGSRPARPAHTCSPGRRPIWTAGGARAGRVKENECTTSVTDFQFTLGGHTLSFRRSYDSLRAGAAGTFGYGWNLTLRDLTIETDVPLTGSEASGVYNPLRDGSR